MHQRCPEDDDGASRAGYRAGLVCRDHEASEAGSPHGRGSVEVVKSQKGTPGSAVGCVVDRHEDCKGVTVTAGGVKENCVL